MEYKKKTFVSFFITMLALLVSSIAVSLAWFIPRNSMNGKNMDGKVLAQYFHCGDGSVEDPFIITRPKHWENLVWLHNNIEDFWRALNKDQTTGGRGFYFEIGCSEERLQSPNDKHNPGPNTYDQEGTKTRYVFKYDNNGATDGSQARELNLNSMLNTPFIPIGDGDKPFIGSLKGNGVTVSNFSVVGSYTDSSGTKQGITDIGIFGYVGEHGVCDNVYFNNFTIDTNGNTIEKSESLTPGHTAHAKHNHENTAYIGYLAGHALYAANFTNCYVNKCTIKGKNHNQNNLDNYGYFGMVDNDVGGGSYYGGGDYKFVMDGPSIYNYINSRYNEISGFPMRLRNSGYDDEPTEDTINNSNPGGSSGQTVTYPLSNGLQRYQSSGTMWANGYTLIGKGPNSTDENRSYSLSTLGYMGYDYETNAHNEEVYYFEGNDTAKTPKIMPYNTQITDHGLDTDSSGTEDGKNYYWYNTSNKVWEYYKSYRFVNTSKHSVTFKLPDSFVSSKKTPVMRDMTRDNGTLTIQIYIDKTPSRDQPTVTLQKTVRTTITRTTALLLPDTHTITVKWLNEGDNEIVVDRYSVENGLAAVIKSYAVFDYGNYGIKYRGNGDFDW